MIDARSAYNAIVGRGWIHEMEGVASTIHQIMRCISPGGNKTVDIQGDQEMAQRCYNIATQNESDPKGKQSAEGSRLQSKGGPSGIVKK